VTGTFLVLVALVVLSSVRTWVALLAGRRAADLREEPYVLLSTAAGAVSAARGDRSTGSCQQIARCQWFGPQ